MNIYNAIMAAADSIELRPALFDFGRIKIPACGTPGCAVGWIGHYLGLPTGEGIHLVEKAIGDIGIFYNRMASIHQTTADSGWWRDSAEICANNLRAYAAKYHAPSITGIPDSVRAIFSDLKAAPDSLADMAGAPSVGR